MSERQGRTLRWRTSSASGGGECVEVAFDAREVLVRDSNAPDGPTLSFTRDAWMEFVRNIDAFERIK